MDFLSGGAGLLLIALIAADIFSALLVPRATVSSLGMGRVIGRSLFPLWRKMVAALPTRDRRQSTRASFAPLVLVLSLVTWAALLIAGFGLVSWALRSRFDHGFDGADDAMFTAAQIFTTLNMTSSPEGAAARIAVIACALSGLAIVTVVATFLISIQAAFARRETLVFRLETRVRTTLTGVAILEAFAREKLTSRLPAFFGEREAWAADVALGHRAFPILVFFRSGDSRREWLAAFGAVLDAGALLESATTCLPADSQACARLTIDVGSRLIEDLCGELRVVRTAEPTLGKLARFREDLARLTSSGYEVVDDEEKRSFEHYNERRRTYAYALADLARFLHVRFPD